MTTMLDFILRLRGRSLVQLAVHAVRCECLPDTICALRTLFAAVRCALVVMYLLFVEIYLILLPHALYIRFSCTCCPSLGALQATDQLRFSLLFRRWQVDERLNGDGTGRPLGINDPTLGFVFFGVAGTIWSLYYFGQKDLGDFEDEDSGTRL